MSVIGQLAKVSAGIKPHDMSDAMLKYLDMLDEKYEVNRFLQSDHRAIPFRPTTAETGSNKLFFFNMLIKGFFFAYSECTGKTRILKNVSRIAQTSLLFAINLIKKSATDGTDALNANLYELQRQNQQAEALPANYREIVRLLALLQANFQPGIERGKQQVAEAKQVQAQHQTQAQEMSSSHQRINVLETQAILHVFMSVLLLKIAKHGKTITVLPKMLEDLSAARTSVDNAEKRLNTKKEELAQVIKEIEELKQQILQIEQEKDPAMDGLLKDLRSQVSTLTTRYQLQLPQTPGISHGSLVRT